MFIAFRDHIINADRIAYAKVIDDSYFLISFASPSSSDDLMFKPREGESMEALLCEFCNAIGPIVSGISDDADPEPDLTPEETETLSLLYDGGIRYLARDDDGKLFGYDEEPYKSGSFYTNPEGNIEKEITGDAREILAGLVGFDEVICVAYLLMV